MKIRALCHCLASLLTLVSLAQQNPAALKYSAFIDTVTASKHLRILASDEFEGRETGTAGAAKAAKYIAGEFGKLGLKTPVNNTFFQDVDLVQQSLKVNNFSVNGASFSHLEDFYIRGFSGSSKIDVSKIVFVGYGISSTKYDDFKNVDVAGKVVMLISSGEPRVNGRSVITGTSESSDWSRSLNKRIDELKARKPALILSVNEGLNTLLQTSRSHLSQAPVSIRKGTQRLTTDIPVVLINTKLADRFLKATGKSFIQLKDAIDLSGKPVSRTVNAEFAASFETKVKDLDAVNVLGYLEGTDLKDELIVISAHYDHVGLNQDGIDKVFNGADDNGSGTTGIIEIAEAFTKAKKEGRGPRRSILFLLVVAEEKGLLGSEWYSDNPIFPLKKTVANLNIDMIGRIDHLHQKSGDYCYLIGSDKLSTDLHKISENANATYTRLFIDYKYNDPNDPERIYYRSDHYHFAKHNIPVIFYFNGIHADYHQPGDEVSKINFPLLVKRAQLVFFTAWDLVNRDKRPVVDVFKK